MVRLVSIFDWIRIDESELSTQHLDGARLSSEEQPARAHMKRTGVLVQYLGRILLRFKRNRIHKNVPPHPAFQDFLHLHQVSGDRYTDAFTFGIHEIDDHFPAFDQIIIKAHFLALMRDQLAVWEMA